MIPPKPMLAHEYPKRGKSITYPAFVQPKLDGIRVIAHREANGVKYYSRLGNTFSTLEHLTPALMDMFPQGTFLDGEIYREGTRFEDICSAVKRDVPNADSKRMQYWIFDFITSDPFFQRNHSLQAWANVSGYNTGIIFLPAAEVKDEDEVKRAHKLFMENGYEGTMIRNRDSYYVQKRSVDLQKFKDFQDDEFEIIGAKECTGKDAGLIKFVCVTKDGVEFDVEPMGDDNSRREMWNKRNELIGKMLTVKFQYYGKNGRPRHPNGVTIRDYE